MIFNNYNKLNGRFKKISQLHESRNKGPYKNETIINLRTPSALMEYCAKEKIEQSVFIETSVGINNFIILSKLKDKKHMVIETLKISQTRVFRKDL